MGVFLGALAAQSAGIGCRILFFKNVILRSNYPKKGSDGSSKVDLHDEVAASGCLR